MQRSARAERFSYRGHRRGFDDVAHVPGGVPPRNQGLTLAPAIKRTHFQRIEPARRGLERGRPSPNGVGAEVSAQPCIGPGAAAVGRKFHLGDAVSAVEGNASYGAAGADGYFPAFGWTGDERADIEAIDGNRTHGRRAGLHARTGIVRDAIGATHPESVVYLVEDADVGQMLDPVG